MNWDELKQHGYVLHVGTRSWNVWYKLPRATQQIHIVKGKKRPSTPVITIQARAYPQVMADFVKRRIEGPQRPQLDITDIRRNEITRWKIKN